MSHDRIEPRTSTRERINCFNRLRLFNWAFVPEAGDLNTESTSNLLYDHLVQEEDRIPFLNVYFLTNGNLISDIQLIEKVNFCFRC